MLQDSSQNVALVITTNGNIEEPVDSTEYVPTTGLLSHKSKTYSRHDCDSKHADAGCSDDTVAFDDVMKYDPAYLTTEKWLHIFIEPKMKSSKPIKNDDDIFDTDDAGFDDDWSKADDNYVDDDGGDSGGDDAQSALDDAEKPPNEDDWGIFRRKLNEPGKGSIFWSDDTALDDVKTDDFFSGDDDTYLVVKSDDWGKKLKNDDDYNDDATSDDDANKDDQRDVKEKDDDWHIFEPNPEANTEYLNKLPSYYKDKNLNYKHIEVNDLSNLLNSDLKSTTKTNKVYDLGKFDKFGKLSMVMVKLHGFNSNDDIKSFGLVVTDPNNRSIQVISYTIMVLY